MRLKGRVALITGAASGMGRALAAELAREGAALGLLDCNAEGLASLIEELQTASAPCASAVADVRDRQAVRTAADALAARLGPVDLLVACAGVTGVTLVDDLDVAGTEKLVQINLLGVVHAIDAVLPGMLARGSGQIVGISSLAGCRGMPFTAAYSASKAGLTTYLESLRPPLRKRGILVTTVFPGFVRTPLMENARVQPPIPMMRPEQAARHILKAILRRKRVYAFPWHTRWPVRVLSWLPPAVFDWLMTRAAAKVADVPY